MIDNLDSDLDQNGNMISKDIIRDREISHRSSVYLLVNFSQMSGLIPLPTINLDRINGCRRVHRIFLRREGGRGGGIGLWCEVNLASREISGTSSTSRDLDPVISLKQRAGALYLRRRQIIKSLWNKYFS